MSSFLKKLVKRLFLIFAVPFSAPPKRLLPTFALPHSFRSLSSGSQPYQLVVELSLPP
jgi:hypothetical protein